MSAKRKHGETLCENGKQKISTEYKTWQTIKERCYNKNSKGFDRYGGRGIKVCDRWLEKFENFLEDMGRRPKNKTSIDRIDVNKDYCKENCRWADKYEQANNRTTNRILIIDGISDTVTNWARKYNFNDTTILERINRGYSLTIEELFKPKQIHKSRTTPKSL